MKRLILSIVLALILTLSLSIPALAATSQDVTVTATPSYMVITNTPSTWTVNDLGTGAENGKGKILVNTIYYANPVNGDHDTTAPSATVLEAECNFEADTTGSTVDTDLTLTWGAFTSGNATMTNSDAGTNGATTYGAYSWFEGELYSGKVITKASGSAVGLDGHSAGAISWGVEILTRTDVWTGGTSSTATLTITATMD